MVKILKCGWGLVCNVQGGGRYEITVSVAIKDLSGERQRNCMLTEPGQPSPLNISPLGFPSSSTLPHTTLLLLLSCIPSAPASQADRGTANQNAGGRDQESKTRAGFPEG